jgi:hypothetical protein
MTTLYDSSAPVKSDRTFGILPRRERRMPYTQADLDWAVRTFAEGADWCARMAADANGDRCEACGSPVECGELEQGLCDVCQCRAEEASMACEYYCAGLGWHTY